MPKGASRDHEHHRTGEKPPEGMLRLLEAIKDNSMSADLIDCQAPSSNLGLKNSLKVLEHIRTRAEQGAELPMRLINKAVLDFSRIISLDNSILQNFAISKSTTALRFLVDILRLVDPSKISNELRKSAAKLSKTSCGLVSKALRAEDDMTSGNARELLKSTAGLTHKVILLENQLAFPSSSEHDLRHSESAVNYSMPLADPPLECVQKLSEFIIEKSDLLDGESAYYGLIALNDFRKARIQRELPPEHPIYSAVTNAVTLVARSFDTDAMIFDRLEKVATALTVFFPDQAGFMQDKIEAMFEATLNCNPIEMASYCQAYRANGRIKKAACYLYAQGKFDEAIFASNAPVSWKYALYAEFALMPPSSLQEDLRKDARERKLKTEDIFRLAFAFYTLDINSQVAAPLADAIIKADHQTLNLTEHTNMLKFLLVSNEITKYVEYFDKFVLNSLPATTRKPDLIKAADIYERLTGRKIKKPAFSFNYSSANIGSLEELYLPELRQTLNKSGIPYKFTTGIMLHGFEIDLQLTLRPNTNSERSIFIDFDGSRYHSVLAKDGLHPCGRDKLRRKFADLFEIDLIELREEELRESGIVMLAKHPLLKEVFDKAGKSA